MEATSVITLMPENKEQIELFISKVKLSVLSGDINPLELDVRLKAIEETIYGIRKDKEVKSEIIKEASKYGKSFDYKNAKITISERGTYDYSNDMKWVELNKKIKERELYLKSIPEEGTVDIDSGEVMYRPPQKYSEIITYKFK